MFSAALKSGAAAAPKDPQFKYVTMLLHGDGTNGAQNNTFLDSSTNNFTITRNGNTTQGTFSPYGSNWSNYFNASASRLEVVNSNSSMIAQGTAFTLEAWVFINTSTATGNNYNTSIPFLCSSVSSSSNSNGRLYSFGTTTFGFWDRASASWLTISWTPPVGQWFHLALVSTGTVFTLYINGTSVGSVTDNTTYYADSGYNFYIASYVGNGTAGSPPIPNMYISNFRYTKSQVYTSSFTPSTTPLTAIANTTVLTCQSNRFIDNSTNAYTVNPLGSTTPSVQRFSPFSPTSAYSTSVIGGSGYFDGSGDYLTIPANTIFRQDQGDWTLEGWFYVTSFATNCAFLSMGAMTSIDNFTVYSTTTGKVGYEAGTGGWAASANYETSAGTINLNCWNHIAWVRSSGSLFIYVNGTRLINQASASFGVNSNNLLYFGDYFGQTTSNAASHYQCDVRFVKGTALYTGATLTIPTTPLTAVTNTSYLLNYTNAGILDNAMMNDLETVGNAQISTSVKKYGTGSLAFDGTGDWLYTPSKPILQLGSSNFTIECWVYLNSTSGAQRPISQSDNNYQFAFYIASGGGLTAYSFQSSGTQNFAISMGTLSINTWYHIACVRNGTTVTAYLNGTSTGTATLSGAIDDRSGGWRFGANYVGTDALNGYIDDVRFTMYPRYTANFTPPTSAFPNQ